MPFEIRSIAPSIQQLIIRDLGQYGGLKSGINKYFYLMNAIYNLQSHIIVNYGEDAFYKEIENELKDKKYVDFKTWADIDSKFKRIRPVLNEIQMVYDDIWNRKIGGGKDTNSMLKYRKLSRMLSPYQPEIFFVFNLLMKISGVQRLTIPKGAFRTPEQDKYVKMPFDRKTKMMEERNIVREEEREA